MMGSSELPRSGDFSMRCPTCKTDNDRVIDSRSSDDGYAIRRRRECLNCKRRYTTYERLEEPVIKVIKKGGVREPFSREKLRSGLEKACWKRPVSAEQIDTIVTDIESEVYAHGDGELESRELGEMLMLRLAKVDQVAFVRFASVYREFKDVNDFVDELQPMLRPRRE
jgi:transcriptional repressor NrdR